MKTLLLALVFGLSMTASPILGSGSWTAFGSNPTNNNSPFWDRASADGANCNIGYFLAGGFGPCGSRKNGTPAAGLQLGAATLEYYSLVDAMTPFTLAAGRYSFALEGRIAGSNTFAVGYRTGTSDLTLFTQADLTGNQISFLSANPFSLYIVDGSNLYRSTDAALPGVMAARDTATGRLYFGFEDRRNGDRDYNDVILSATVETPEPATFALVGLVLVVAGIFRRRR